MLTYSQKVKKLVTAATTNSGYCLLSFVTQRIQIKHQLYSHLYLSKDTYM